MTPAITHGHRATSPNAVAQRGFTLVELIITLTIFALVLAMAIPAFTDTVRQNRMTTQANDIQALLLLARVEAIKRGVEIDVDMSPGDGVPGWDARVVDPTDLDESLRRVEHGGTPTQLGTTWAAIDNRWTIRFDSLGRQIEPFLSEARIALEHAGCLRSQRRELVIELSGRVYVDDTVASRVCGGAVDG